MKNVKFKSKYNLETCTLRLDTTKDNIFLTDSQVAKIRRVFKLSHSEEPCIFSDNYFVEITLIGGKIGLVAIEVTK